MRAAEIAVGTVAPNHASLYQRVTGVVMVLLSSLGLRPRLL